MNSVPITKKWNDFWLAPSQFLQRAEDLVAKAEKSSEPEWLFYSALETRYCIERLLSQYLFVVSKGRLSKETQQLWQAKTLKASILKQQPDLIARLRFYSLWHKAKRWAEPFEVPDLSDYLHLPNKDQQSFYSAAKVSSLLLLLRESQEELRRHCYDDLPPMKMNPRLEEILNQAKIHNLSDEVITGMIKGQ
jgi:hypothetical protein